MHKVSIQRILSGLLLAFCIAKCSWAQSQEEMPAKDSYPFFFKVYSKEGRESLTASCSPTKPAVKSLEVDEIECKFVNVRFSNPLERIDKQELNIPTTLQEAVDRDSELREELRKSPQKATEMSKAYPKVLDQARQDACAASSKEMKRIQSQITDPASGPKRRKILQALLDACQEKTPALFFQRLTDLERRSCDVWVDNFQLIFKKIAVGTWLFQTDTPGLLSNVLKTYELRPLHGHSTLVTLTETRIPVSKGTESKPQEKPQQTVWSWDNYSQYEISCDFITHNSVQAPIPR